VSRAFKRESDESGAEEMPAVRPQLPPGTRNYITREGADKLRNRLGELLETKRASAGSDSETDQRRLDATIKRLQGTLTSVVIAETPADRTRIAFGACVTIRHEDGEEDEYRIVGVDETDPGCGWISWISPLARVLLSKTVGDKFQFLSPAGQEDLMVVKVQYPPPSPQ
jgi:transcription elongation factor GreB